MRPLLAWTLRVTLLCLSLALVLLIFEVGLRLLGYQAIYSVYSKPSLLWQHDELLGWSHAPYSSDTYIGPRPWPVEFSAPVEINSLGLRGPEPRDLPPEGYRILFMGDSMVAGLEVPYESTFVHLLEKGLNAEFDFPIEVINAGVRGYGTDQSYLYYLERGRALKPDMVVFRHSENDPVNNMTLHRMRRPFSKAAFVLDGTGAMELHGNPVPSYPLCSAYSLNEDYVPMRMDSLLNRILCVFETRLADHSAAFTFLALTLRNRPSIISQLHKLTSPRNSEAAFRTDEDSGVGEFTRSPADELTFALIEVMAKTVRSDGVEFVMFSKPLEQERLGDADLQALGLPLHSVLITPEISGDRRYHFVNDSHLNEYGHQLEASLITPVIAERIRETGAGAQAVQPAGGQAEEAGGSD